MERSPRNRSLSLPPGGMLWSARITDVYSRAWDSRHLLLWQRAASVVPTSAFERVGCWIRSGHYVILYKGEAIVVHCANLDDGRISVQFMFGEPLAFGTVRSTIEPLLLGQLVASETQQAAVSERRRISHFFKDKDGA